MHLGWVICIIISLLRTALADFDVFFVAHPHGKGSREHPLNYQVLDAGLRTCPDPWKTRLFWYRKDVSGKKQGVRCRGSGCISGNGQTVSFQFLAIIQAL